MDITAQQTIKSVLLLRYGTLNSVVYTTGVIDALRLEYGDMCEIDIVCTPNSASLFDYDTRIRHVYTLAYTSLPALLSWGKLSLVVKSLFCKYDLIINFESSRAAASLVAKLRSTFKSGYPVLIESQSSAKWRYRHFKMQDYYRHFISEKNLQRTNPSIQSAPFEPIKFKYNLPGNYIVINPGNSHVDSRTDYRIWPEKYWKYLLYRLVKENYSVVITGSVTEKRLIKEKIDIGNIKSVIDLAGKTTLAESAAVFENARCCVTTDGAAAHIAGAVGATVITLFGPTSKYDGPVPDPRNSVIALSAELECSPCYNTPRLQQCRENICMKKITIKQVYEAIKQVFYNNDR